MPVTPPTPATHAPNALYSASTRQKVFIAGAATLAFILTQIFRMSAYHRSCVYLPHSDERRGCVMFQGAKLGIESAFVAAFTYALAFSLIHCMNRRAERLHQR